MAVNKVILGEDTLIDLTADTVSADKLSKGVNLVIKVYIFNQKVSNCSCSTTTIDK